MSEMIELELLYERPEKREPLGPFFWVCVGWLGPQPLRGHLRQRATPAQPALRRLQLPQRRAVAAPPLRHRRPRTRHLLARRLRVAHLDRRGRRLDGHRVRRRRAPGDARRLPAGPLRHDPHGGHVHPARLPRDRRGDRGPVLLDAAVHAQDHPGDRTGVDPPRLPGHPHRDHGRRHQGLHHRGQGPGRHRPAHPDEGAAAQHHAHRDLVPADRHRHRRHARGRAGLPRALGQPADPFVGQHDQREPARSSPRTRGWSSSRRWRCACSCSCLNFIGDRLRSHFDVTEAKL